MVAYYSGSGHTQAMAEAVAKGASSVDGVEVKIISVSKAKADDVLEAQAIILGSPVYNGNIAPEMLQFINTWPFEGRPMQDKIGAAFATGGGISIGEEQVMLGLLQAMLIQGMMVMGGEEAEASFGASAITGEEPFEGVQDQFLMKAEGLGRRVAMTTLRLKK